MTGRRALDEHLGRLINIIQRIPATPLVRDMIYGTASKKPVRHAGRPSKKTLDEHARQAVREAYHIVKYGGGRV